MTISILAQRAGMGAGLPGLFLVLIACAAVPIRAQQPALRFGHFTRDHGLSHNTVNTILEDHIGFMWFGTYDGLNRYDGNTFTRYRNDSQDPYSLSHNVVRTLLEDREQVLWIGTEDGLNRYDRARDTFILYRNEETDHTSVSNNLVYALYEDREGELWIGTYWGLNRFDRDTQTFVRYSIDEQNPERDSSQPQIRALTGDSQGYLWIGTTAAGLKRLDPKTGALVHYLHDKADPGSISQMTSGLSL